MMSNVNDRSPDTGNNEEEDKIDRSFKRTRPAKNKPKKVSSPTDSLNTDSDEEENP